ncbi:hypothetical protein BKA80DRAFT_291141 [Phyllosticta citrichinensis]
MATPRLRVGLVGAGEVTQVIHLPALSLLSHLYTIEAVCDISKKNSEHCAAKFHIPKAATNAYDVINDSAVDVVFVLTSDEYHEQYVVAALNAGKKVFIEKPIALSVQSAQRIADANRAAGGSRVFVGYMRRYAPSFWRAFKREIAGIDQILYARVRDFSGPNKSFVDQSGTFQVKNTDDIPSEAGAERERLLDALFAEAFPGKPSTPERRTLWRFLGSLASHDISLMREVLGFPESIGGVSANGLFYSAILNFRNRGRGGDKGAPFAVTYESGIDSVPEFDAHLAVYGQNKRVSIHYDSPYVKGLPIKVRVAEVNAHGEFVTREMLSSYEDAYTAELQEMHASFAQGRPIKTTPEDALQDLRLFDMIISKYEETVAA